MRRLAHAQVLHAAEHLERQRRLEVLRRREHAHQAVEDAAAGAPRRHPRLDDGVGAREEQEDLGALVGVALVVRRDLVHRVDEQLEDVEVDERAAQVVARRAPAHVEHRLDRTLLLPLRDFRREAKLKRLRDLLDLLDSRHRASLPS